MQGALTGHRYIQGVDPAITYDSTWVSSWTRRGSRLSVSWPDTRPVGPRRRSSRLWSPTTHNAYTGDGYRCTTGVDTTGFGGAMFRDALPITIRSRRVRGHPWAQAEAAQQPQGCLEQRKLRFPRSGPLADPASPAAGLPPRRQEPRDRRRDGAGRGVGHGEVEPTRCEQCPFDYFGGGTKGVASRTSIGPPGPNFGRRVVTYTSLRDMKRRGG